MSITEEKKINNVSVLEFSGVYTDSKAPDGSFTNEFSMSLTIGDGCNNAAFEIEDSCLEESAPNQILILDRDAAIKMAQFILKSFNVSNLGIVK